MEVVVAGLPEARQAGGESPHHPLRAECERALPDRIDAGRPRQGKIVEVRCRTVAAPAAAAECPSKMAPARLAERGEPCRRLRPADLWGDAEEVAQRRVMECRIRSRPPEAFDQHEPAQQLGGTGRARRRPIGGDRVAFKRVEQPQQQQRAAEARVTRLHGVMLYSRGRGDSPERGIQLPVRKSREYFERRRGRASELPRPHHVAGGECAAQTR